MKALLIGESRQGKIEDSTYELVGFAKQFGMESAMFIVAKNDSQIAYEGKVYLADSDKYKEYNPDAHKKLIEEAINKENPDYIIFSHSSYGWDMAFRVAADLKVAPISEVVDYKDGTFVVPCCNSKFRREVKPKTDKAVLTLQGGAFNPVAEGTPQIEILDIGDIEPSVEFIDYEVQEKTGVDLTKAEIIVSVGRGVGKKENIEFEKELAETLGGAAQESGRLALAVGSQIGFLGENLTR